MWDSELQGFGKNEILGVPLKRIAKYDVFWKWLNFKQFLGSQLEAPQFLRDTRKKDSVFCIFAISQSRAPRNLDKKWQFRMEAPGFWTGGNGKNGQDVGSESVGALNLKKSNSNLMVF